MDSESPRKFYVRSSGGFFHNLQRYALDRGLDEWRAIEEACVTDGREPRDLLERCVLTVAILGLSVCQLLGQNNPDPPEAGRIQKPRRLFEMLRARYPGHLDPLAGRFSEFMDRYDDCRHFGVTGDHSKHRSVLSLDREKTGELVQTAVDVWVAVIQAFDEEPSADLAAFRIVPADEEFYLPPDVSD